VPAGTLPTEHDIDTYFTEVENALIARRIRAVQSVREQARTILKRFNSLEGPVLYPRIIDTECRLQADQGAYQRYVFQMQVYADLFRQRMGVAPVKAILYFLNELSGEPAPQHRPVNALLEVSLDAQEVQQALQSFGQTVQDIEHCRASRLWPGPTVAPQESTCNACDLRWTCTAAAGFGRQYPFIYP
jgi:putative RecB family exonuclease